LLRWRVGRCSGRGAIPRSASSSRSLDPPTKAHGRNYMAGQIPLVDYLVLGDQPHLEANECTKCGARFFDRRNACAHCFNEEFRTVSIGTEGVLRTFTIVAYAAPGVQVPFVAGVIDCDGTSVRANVINVEPDPEHVH